MHDPLPNIRHPAVSRVRILRVMRPWIFRCARWLFFTVGVFLLTGHLGGQGVNADGWRIAEPGYVFHFPADHGPHPGFRTEWWYFTGNLAAGDGREFGFELTFFRHGYRPPDPARTRQSPFATGEVKFAHFTITDVNERHFYPYEKISRGAFGEAGYNRGGTLVWIEDWQVDYNGDFRLRAAAGQCAIDLELEPEMAPVLQGVDGFSRKADGPGRASYYYSIPRLKTRGTVRLGVNTWAVTGISWFDREWATNQLEPQQAGWNWFAIELDDGSSLMLYQMRLKDGGIDPYSSGKYVNREGQVTPVARDDFQLVPNRFWQRDRSAPRYPTGWQLSIPKLALALTVMTPVEDQELRLSSRYWEGCIRLTGTRAGQPIRGTGYMELTGYGGAVAGLTSP